MRCLRIVSVIKQIVYGSFKPILCVFSHPNLENPHRSRYSNAHIRFIWFLVVASVKNETPWRNSEVGVNFQLEHPDRRGQKENLMTVWDLSMHSCDESYHFKFPKDKTSRELNFWFYRRISIRQFKGLRVSVRTGWKMRRVLNAFSYIWKLCEFSWRLFLISWNNRVATGLEFSTELCWIFGNNIKLFQ